MKTLVAIVAVCFTAGSASLAAEFVWSRIQVRSVSPMLFQGARIGITTAYVADTINPEVCVMVIRDDRTGHIAAVGVPRLSCELHGSAQ